MMIGGLGQNTAFWGRKGMTRNRMGRLTRILHPAAVLAWGAAIMITAFLGRSAWQAVEEAERAATYYATQTDTLMD